MVFKCDVCEKTFSRKHNLSRRKPTCKGPKSMLKFKINDEGLHSCKKCSYSTKDRSNILRHIITCDTTGRLKALTCKLCGKIFGRVGNRERHEATVHKLKSGRLDKFQTPIESVQNVSGEECDAVPQPVSGPSMVNSANMPEPVLSAQEEQEEDTVTPYLPVPSHPETDDLFNQTVEEVTQAAIDHLMSIGSRQCIRTDEETANELAVKFGKLSINHISSLCNSRTYSKNEDRELGWRLIVEILGVYLIDSKMIVWICNNSSFRTVPEFQEKILQYLNGEMSSGYSEGRNVKFSEAQVKQVYNFWKDSSIVTVDRRSGRDIVKMRKAEYKSMATSDIIDDENVKDKVQTLKSGTQKYLVEAPKMILSKSIRDLHKDFNQKHAFSISLSNFYSFKPFYILPATEREKESCLCVVCFNLHQMLDALKRLSEKTELYKSLSEFYQGFTADENFALDDAKTKNQLVSYYVFEKKQETYFTAEGKETTYDRVARVDKKETFAMILTKLLAKKERYLHHRKVVDADRVGWPLLMEAAEELYVLHLDFSMNIAITPKKEVQAAHFSGKQYSLHCLILTNEKLGINHYIYHLSDDTRHDWAFVHEILHDVFIQYDIKQQTVIIKSDNYSEQYKCLNTFGSMVSLCDEFGLTVIRVYSPAGHGKGTIDAMSSFGVKSILMRDIVGQDVFFANSQEIVDHLRKKQTSLDNWITFTDT